MEKLMLTPDADGYSDTEGVEVLHTALDGGQGRYRRDKIGASKQVRVTWTMNPAQYQYWRAFYWTAINGGTMPFLCELVSEDGTGAVDHVCNFVPGSVSKPSQRGLEYKQTAVLEVRPLPRNEAEDLAVLFLYSSYGVEGSDLLAAIDLLANTVIPEAAGA